MLNLVVHPSHVYVKTISPAEALGYWPVVVRSAEFELLPCVWQVEGELLGPLCRDVENDLRLQIHTKTLEHVMAAINPKYEHCD